MCVWASHRTCTTPGFESRLVMSITWPLLGRARLKTVVRPRNPCVLWRTGSEFLDRKSTRLNSSHLVISYAVFCLKKKKKKIIGELKSSRHVGSDTMCWRTVD